MSTVETCPAPVRAKRVGAVVLAVLGAALLLGPMRQELLLSWGTALGIVAAFAGLGVALALPVRRAEQGVSGPRFESTHEGVRVTRVDRQRSGDLTLALAWDARHHIELDDTGLPLGITSEGPGSCEWTLAGGSRDLRRLQELTGHPLSLTEQGHGSSATRRVLASSSGVVLDLQS